MTNRIYDGSSAGWYFEGPDPSVGIFGHCWIHDCDSDDEIATTEALISEGHEGDYFVQRWQIICTCGATFLDTTYDYAGYPYPEEEEDFLK